MITNEERTNPAVDAQTLAPLVCKALVDEQAKLLDWSCTRLPCYGVNPVTTGIFRFSGKADSDGALTPWSLILKQVYWPNLDGSGKGFADKPADWNYWKREAFAFQSDLLRHSQGGLLSVPCYAVSELNPSTIWIWLQDLGDDAQDVWPIERHILAAQHFGEFNGAHLGYEPSPDDARWLSKQHHRKWLDWLNSWGMSHTASDTNFWATRFAQTAFPHGTDACLRHLLKHVDRLCDLLAQQTQTLSHQDSHRANLFATASPDGEPKTTAIDWSFLGMAAIGEDLGTQIGGNLFKLFVDPSRAKSYLADATEAYIAGLRQSGWQGQADSIRFACAATACLRYAPFGVMWLQGCLQANARGEISGMDNLAQVHGLSTDQALRQWGAAMSYLFDLGDKAMRLASRI